MLNEQVVNEVVSLCESLEKAYTRLQELYADCKTKEDKTHFLKIVSTKTNKSRKTLLNVFSAIKNGKAPTKMSDKQKANAKAKNQVPDNREHENESDLVSETADLLDKILVMSKEGDAIARSALKLVINFVEDLTKKAQAGLAQKQVVIRKQA